MPEHGHPSLPVETIQREMLEAAIDVGRLEARLTRLQSWITLPENHDEILDGEEQSIGWLAYNHPEILRGLHFAENILRNPGSLAFFIQAASFGALERAGRMIAERIGGRRA